MAQRSEAEALARLLQIGTEIEAKINKAHGRAKLGRSSRIFAPNLNGDWSENKAHGGGAPSDSEPREWWNWVISPMKLTFGNICRKYFISECRQNTKKSSIINRQISSFRTVFTHEVSFEDVASERSKRSERSEFVVRRVPSLLEWSNTIWLMEFNVEKCAVVNAPSYVEFKKRIHDSEALPAL